MEDFRVGDRVLSRDEFDSTGAIEAKVVEEIFVHQALAWHLHVGGQTIRTTAEHPFWIEGKGWLAVNQLVIGDRLLSSDGTGIEIEDLLDTGEWETVYNPRVSDHHTYFVGTAEWGWAAWAHNAYNLNSNGAISKFGIYEIKINGVLYKVGKADMNRITQSSGLPTRLHQQIRKLEQQHGKANVTHTLTPIGRTTTLQAKLAETARLQAVFDQTGIVPFRNLRSFIPRLP